MKKALLICALALTILGGFHLIPSGRLGGEPADSPLFAQSLGDSKDNLSDPKNPIAGTDGKGEGAQACGYDCPASSARNASGPRSLPVAWRTVSGQALERPGRNSRSLR